MNPTIWFEYMLVSTRRKYKRGRMLRLLRELQESSEHALTLYIPAGLTPPEIEKMLVLPLGGEDIIPDITSAASLSPRGAVLLWGEGGKHMVLPPFPVTEKLFSSGYNTEPLRSQLEREYTVALILLRLGAYAVGVFRGEELISSKVGRGYVHARHSKGGSSQKRFARSRQKDIEQFFVRVCARVQERVEPCIEQLDYVIYGGERHTLLAFRKKCRFTETLNDRVLETLLNVREPRQATLETAIESVWASTVFQWHEIRST